MKLADLLTIAAMAVLGFVAYKLLKPGTTMPAAKTYANGYASEIANAANPGDPGWGWAYYTDGVSIGPDGTYYKSGVKIVSPS